MKDSLPQDHGLTPEILSNNALVPPKDGNPFITNIQYEALRQGVARSESLLVVAPTATGKTLIAIWALISTVQQGCNGVYLVTHRALAKQKFEELQRILLQSSLQNIPEAIVIATGDGIADASGNTPADPLSAPVVIATYEKYLAMLAAAPRRDMTGTTLICDEVQLLGDLTRGQDVEILLTLLKRAGWKQFVGLSAVLTEADAEELADWLGVTLVRTTEREKRLVYECRLEQAIYQVDTDNLASEPMVKSSQKVTTDTLEIVQELRGKPERLPIIVFCMRIQDTYALARAYGARYPEKSPEARPSLFGHEPETQPESLLASYIPRRFALHNADLSEEERSLVEQAIAERKVDVVFSTSTLAAGVNFPFGSAVFHTWTRYDPDRQQRVPIDMSEFQNMAGRAGRMGTDHEYGLVIYTASSPRELASCRRYLDVHSYTRLARRISHTSFERLILQLASAGICDSEEETYALLASTFSGKHVEAQKDEALSLWKSEIGHVVNRLREIGCII